MIYITITGERQTGKTTEALRMIAEAENQGLTTAYVAPRQEHAHYAKRKMPIGTKCRFYGATENGVLGMMPPHLLVLDDHDLFPVRTWEDGSILDVMGFRMRIFDRPRIVIVHTTGGAA